jgi:hypothetical protein
MLLRQVGRTVVKYTCRPVGIVGRALGLRLKRPVFVVGTGRCGTTLLMKVLQSHNQLATYPGEANELWHPKLEPYETASLDLPPIEIDPKRFTAVSVANWPTNHARTIRDTFTGFHMCAGRRKTLVVKSAMVSFMLPELLALFPDARFVHIGRFAPAVVESYVKKNFGKYSRYAYSEREYRAHCADYWNACIMEIEHRKTSLGLVESGQFLDLSYEDLCANPRKAFADVARFLDVAVAGFSFDPSTIASQNEKAPDYSLDPQRAGLLQAMAPGMQRRGYGVSR